MYSTILWSDRFISAVRIQRYRLCMAARFDRCRRFSSVIENFLWRKKDIGLECRRTYSHGTHRCRSTYFTEVLPAVFSRIARQTKLLMFQQETETNRSTHSARVRSQSAVEVKTSCTCFIKDRISIVRRLSPAVKVIDSVCSTWIETAFGNDAHTACTLSPERTGTFQTREFSSACQSGNSFSHSPWWCHDDEEEVPLMSIDVAYLEKLNRLLVGSPRRWSSSTSFTTSAADWQVLAIFCSNAIVVLVLNKPTARLLRPCNRHASTAPRSSQIKSIISLATQLPQSVVTLQFSSCTHFFITASSIICLT